jgi:CBS domain-containing protein
MKAGDVMMHEIITIRPDAPVLEAMQLMLRHDISGVPVVDDGGNLVGIVTESDFLRPADAGVVLKRRRLIEALFGSQGESGDRTRLHDCKVKEVMTVKLITVTEGTSLAEAVRLMREHDLKRLLVVKNDRLVGVISRADLIGALARAIHETTNAQKDTARRREELAKLEQ